MRGGTIRPIVLAAGGTGGHFFPAEALAAELAQRGHRVALMTDARSGAGRSAVFEGREVFVLRGAGLAGRGVLRAAGGALSMAAGTAQARRILHRLHASVMVGFGGYPCVAPILAARTLPVRPAIVLHEQNAVLGRANRVLTRFADALALSFDTTERVPRGAATAVTGNPVRPAILTAATPYAPPTGEIRLLVLGGSLGARVFSDLLPGAVAALSPALRARLRIAQQCRAEDLDRVRAAYAAAGLSPELSPFFPEMAERLAACHLVIARAGASTVAELAVAGRPALLVPLPHAIDDHQAANAAALHGTAGAAWTLPQAGLTPGHLAARLRELLAQPGELAAVAAQVASQARPHAAAALADLIEVRIAHATTGATTGAATTQEIDA